MVRNTFARLRRGETKRPPPPLVVSWLAVSVGMWVVIYAYSGRVIWTW